MLRTIDILISGKVQGVFFRQSAKEKALEIGIQGKVMNLPDGRVQVTATGTQKQLEDLLNWCRQGPSRARVTDIFTRELPLQDFSDFIIQRL